ncbi:hypothetical protein F2S74_15780, partial [Pseudomonas syringae pv. actinidiae]|nr:hypothetical protein [Pseudomonas syringae pv. actinidiae]
MSSPSDRFECHWQASRLLLTAYFAVQLLALTALCWLDIPLWASVAGALLCLAHAVWVIPRALLLSHPAAVTALRRDDQGWQVWSERGRLASLCSYCPDSLALPLVVILRFRPVVQGRPSRIQKAVGIPGDALTPDIHRRLRVRLKFSRRKWAV